MAPTDRKHEKKLREAERSYNKWKKAFLAGRISKDELKDKLRPYKYELHELNLVKLKESDHPSTEGEDEPASEKKVIDVQKPTTYPPWKKASSLTIEDIEGKVDQLSLGAKPSETLQMLYEKRYGEDLAPPQDLVSFHVDDEDDSMEDLPTRSYSELPPVEESSEGADDEGDVDDKGSKKKRFWKGLLKRKKGEA